MLVKSSTPYPQPRIRKPWWIPAVAAVLVAILVGLAWILWPGASLPPSEMLSEASPAEGDGVASGAGTNVVVDATTTNVPVHIAMLLDEAGQLAAADKLVDARLKYLEALKHATSPVVVRQIEQRVEPVNLTLLFTPRHMPEKVDYVIKRGDSLGGIASRFGTTAELLQKSNQISNPHRIKVGDRLRVFTGKFELVASKSTHEMVVLMNGEFFKRFKVGTGLHGKTPVGTFVVSDKIPEPSWWPPDGREVPFGHKDNILGTRWMAVKATGETPDVRGYGIHGTWAPDSVGKASSAGCLRMINEQVEELFTYLPLGTPLRINE